MVKASSVLFAVVLAALSLLTIEPSQATPLPERTHVNDYYFIEYNPDSLRKAVVNIFSREGFEVKAKEGVQYDDVIFNFTFSLNGYEEEGWLINPGNARACAMCVLELSGLERMFWTRGQADSIGAPLQRAVDNIEKLANVPSAVRGEPIELEDIKIDPIEPFSSFADKLRSAYLAKGFVITDTHLHDGLAGFNLKLPSAEGKLAAYVQVEVDHKSRLMFSHSAYVFSGAEGADFVKRAHRLREIVVAAEAAAAADFLSLAGQTRAGR